jgi:hypothetical protein
VVTEHSTLEGRRSTFAPPWPEVNAWRQELHRDFERALAETPLPERPDYEAANRFLVKARQAAAGQRVGMA